jgi:serine/threonine protein kinase
MSFQTGDTIADYQILGVLGRGGMGAVYQVRNLLTGREEAMKVVLPDYAADPDAADRFLREIKIQASLQHPNITALRTAVRAENHILMIMELVEGASLEAMLKSGPLPLAQAIRITDDILGALGYAHERGVIHRDVKPSNIVVTSRGLPKLMDFGIARAAGDIRLTQSGMAVGSLYYMSPEQVLSKPVDQRSDLYSMGATFYEMLTGRRPVEGEGQYAVMNAHLSLVPPAPSDIAPGVPRDVSSVALKSLAKAPEQRYQTAAEFQSAVRQTIFGSTAKFEPRAPIDPGTLEAARKALAAYLGPMASMVVNKVARNVSSKEQLKAALAAEIHDEQAKRVFLASF